MSIQWMDNFGSYGTGGQGSSAIARLKDGTVYTSTSIATSLGINPDGLGGDTVLNVGITTLSLPSLAKIAGVAARYWLPAMPVSDDWRPSLCEFRRPDGTRMYRLMVEPNGALSVYYGTTQNQPVSSALATTGIPAIFTNSWVHFEFKVNTTTGDFEVRREGSVLLSGTHGTPPNIDIGIVYFKQDGATDSLGTPYRIKDFILWDTTGSNNNDFVGPCAVFRLPVDSDVSSGWTRSSGSTDWELLDEVPPNDSDYISAEDDPLPAPSIMGFANLPDYIVGVRALQTMVRAWKTDGGDANLQVSLISEGDEDAGANRNVSTTPTYWWDISELSPDTAAPWNPIEVNNATIKIDRTA